MYVGVYAGEGLSPNVAGSNRRTGPGGRASEGVVSGDGRELRMGVAKVWDAMVKYGGLLYESVVSWKMEMIGRYES